MNTLIPFKKYIGCEDCRSQWEDCCPLCKIKGSSMKSLDGKSRKMKQYKFIRTENEIYYFHKIINNPSKKQNGIKITKKNHNKVLDLRNYWSRKHPKRVISLILYEHDPACRCCYSLSNLTFDHIIPLNLGGVNELDNGQILCYHCNQLKSDRIVSIDNLRIEMLEIEKLKRKKP